MPSLGQDLVSGRTEIPDSSRKSVGALVGMFLSARPVASSGTWTCPEQKPSVPDRQQLPTVPGNTPGPTEAGAVQGLQEGNCAVDDVS